jgi:hypothetical protein
LTMSAGAPRRDFTVSEVSDIDRCDSHNRTAYFVVSGRARADSTRVSLVYTINLHYSKEIYRRQELK